ncbi:MAG: ATP-dependent zinc protease [Planctomycetaceae bacterium]|nr:ATP-dependent zinc protease [Planctomycetaceae bacterium]
MISDETELMPVIGWREWIALPDLGIDHVKAKIDTGARSSSLHAIDIQFVRREGQKFVTFRTAPRQGDDKHFVEAEAEVLEVRNVRSSNGEVSKRPVIVTHVSVLGMKWPIELTLVNREEMGFRMLLGREAVRGRFLVDAGNSYFGGRRHGRRRLG